ncbi:MAG: hypothetical protein D6689_11845 [Deltaproteobacteria bacterium]|nr:MAG: hypothetical protein D6689_11845 [Deltaproteobacteria bacterium]
MTMATAPTRPRFRSDLVATPLEIEGQRFIDVTDPDTEQTFRFYEVEYSVACAMNGERDVDALIRWSVEELGLEPTRDEVETVIGTLADLGYLAPDAEPAGDARTDDDLGLGAPGAPEPARPAAAEAPADVELGEPGAAPEPPPRPAPPAVPPGPEEMDLGAPGAAGPGKVTMGWDAPPVDPDELAKVLGTDPLGPAGVSGDLRAEVEAELPPPPAGPPPEVPVPSLVPSGSPEESGPTQIPEPAVGDYDDDDVSIDLSDHLSIGADDVKEAVRQSRTMDAVQVPPDLADALDDDEPTQARPRPPESAAPDSDRAETAPADRAAELADAIAQEADDGAASAPVELPSEPPPAEPARKQPAAAPATEPPAGDSRGVSGGLIAFVVLALAAAGVGYWYFNMYQPKSPAPPPPAPRPVAAPAAPAKPAVPTARLVEAEPDTSEVTAIDDGVIENIAVAGDEVDRGAIVASLKGVAAIERSLARPRRKFAEYSKALEEARAAGKPERVIAHLEKKVAEKRGLIVAGETKLTALQMRAPIAGRVEPLVEAGAKVERGQPVLRIVGEPTLTATFPRGNRTFHPGDRCEVAPAKDPTKPIECVVTRVEGTSVTVRVPRDAGLAAGDAVVLK